MCYHYMYLLSRNIYGYFNQNTFLSDVIKLYIGNHTNKI